MSTNIKFDDNLRSGETADLMNSANVVQLHFLESTMSWSFVNVWKGLVGVWKSSRIRRATTGDDAGASVNISDKLES